MVCHQDEVSEEQEKKRGKRGGWECGDRVQHGGISQLEKRGEQERRGHTYILQVHTYTHTRRVRKEWRNGSKSGKYTRQGSV